MAASITIGSLSLDSTGKVVTGTLAGGTGTGYAPASGITNLVVKFGAGAYRVLLAATAISGSTITATLPFSISAADTVLVDLLTSGNLVDSGSNTVAASQTNKAVTNGSTVASSASVAAASAAVAFIGPKTFNAGIGGYYAPNGGASEEAEIAFQVRGTDLAMIGQANYQVSVDGGAFSTITVPGTGVFYRSAIFTGLSDAVHTVIVKTYNYVASPESFYASGSAPVFSRHPDYTDVLDIRDATTVSHIKISGAWGYSNVNTNNLLFCTSYWDNNIEFRGNPTKIGLYGQWGTALNIYQDGVLVGSAVTGSGPAGFTNRKLQFISGLDGLTHVYRIESAIYTGSARAISHVVLGGGTMDVTYNGSYGLLVTALGDSITQFDLPGYPAGAYVRVLAGLLNWDCSNAGVGGTTVWAAGGNGLDTNARVGVVLRKPPTALVIHMGINDLHTGRTADQVKVAFTSFLNRLLSAGVTADGVVMPPLTVAGGTQKIVVLGLLDGAGGHGEPNRTDYNAAIIAGIAAATPGPGAPPITFIQTTAGVWPTFGTADFLDDTHPSAQGHALMANALLPYFLTSGRGNRFDFNFALQ